MVEDKLLLEFLSLGYGPGFLYIHVYTTIVNINSPDSINTVLDILHDRIDRRIMLRGVRE